MFIIIIVFVVDVVVVKVLKKLLELKNDELQNKMFFVFLNPKL